MKTQVIKANAQSIELAAKYIASEEIIGFPTETVYGLGANAFSEIAVSKIYAAKNRPPDNPLIVHIANKQELRDVVKGFSNLEEILMDSFWPGPLSIILKASERIPKIVTAGLDTVAVRVPAHPVAREIILKAKRPIAAPSANISGRPSSTSAKHVYNDFAGKIPLIIDGGDCQFGLESTVIKVSKTINILRPGAITKEMLEKFARVEYQAYSKDGAAISPGIKHPHYHPNANILLVKGTKDEIREKILNINIDDVGYFGLKEFSLNLNTKASCLLESENLLYTYAEKMYAFFRECDLIGVKNIVIHEVPRNGLGHAIMDRIEKAADKII